MNQGFVGWSTPQLGSTPYINIQDQKAQNTAGGTFTSGADRTRDLNTIVNDVAGIASLASNQITLPAGRYRCAIRCPALQVQRHQAWLYDVTNAVVLLRGSSEFENSTGTASSHSFIAGEFTLTVATVLEVRHRCQLTHSSNGLGIEANFGIEVYTTAEFWKAA